MSEIYAVSSGSYSDYGVQAIFERREDAEAAVAAGFGHRSYDKPEVEEFVYYTAGQMPKKYAMVQYFAEVEIADGSLAREGSYPDDEWLHPSAKPRRIETTIRPWPYVGTPSRMTLRVHGLAGTRTHKVFTDALAKLRAECIEGLHSEPKRRLP